MDKIVECLEMLDKLKVTTSGLSTGFILRLMAGCSDDLRENVITIIDVFERIQFSLRKASDDFKCVSCHIDKFLINNKPHQ